MYPSKSTRDEITGIMKLQILFEAHPKILETIRAITVDAINTLKTGGIDFTPVNRIDDFKYGYGGHVIGWHIGDMQILNVPYEIWMNMNGQMGLGDKHQSGTTSWSTAPNIWYDIEKVVQSIKSRIGKKAAFASLSDAEKLIATIKKKGVEIRTPEYGTKIAPIVSKSDSFHDEDEFSHSYDKGPGPSTQRTINELSVEIDRLLRRMNHPITDENIRKITDNTVIRVGWGVFSDALEAAGIKMSAEMQPSKWNVHITKNGLELPTMVWNTYNPGGPRTNPPPPIKLPDNLTNALMQYWKIIMDKATASVKKIR